MVNQWWKGATTLQKSNRIQIHNHHDGGENYATGTYRAPSPDYSRSLGRQPVQGNAPSVSRTTAIRPGRSFTFNNRDIVSSHGFDGEHLQRYCLPSPRARRETQKRAEQGRTYIGQETS